MEWACWCRCRVLLPGAAVRVMCALLDLAFWCHCRVLLSEGCVQLRNGCYCRVLLSECAVGCEAWVLVSLQGVWSFGFDGDYVYAMSKKEGIWLPPKHIFCNLGSMLAYFFPCLAVYFSFSFLFLFFSFSFFPNSRMLWGLQP